MTKKEIEYLSRLHDRRKILKTRLSRTSKNASFYADIKKEFNAINWAVEFVEGVWEDERDNSCDVKGCTRERSSGGLAWRETGYWSACSEHGRAAREGKKQPKMTDEAVARNASRNLKTGFVDPAFTYPFVPSS